MSKAGKAVFNWGIQLVYVFFIFYAASHDPSRPVVLSFGLFTGLLTLSCFVLSLAGQAIITIMHPFILRLDILREL
jgi:hypothetical protein